MPILSRRSIQKLIFEISEIVSPEDLCEIVEKINKENIQSLNALWEIIVLWLFSKQGKVSYEANHGGRTNPDLFFRSIKGVELVADITCVSDQDQDKNNDVKYFNKELCSVARKVGIDNLSGIYIRIEDDERHKNKKIKLKLPAKNNVRNFVELKIKPFLLEVSRNRRRPRRIDINEDQVELSIVYKPNSNYLTSSYPSYTVAKSLTNNPIYNRLKSKSRQLKESGFEGLKGVIVCDGGCDLITSSIGGVSGYDVGSIIQYFLRQQDTISFVITLFVEENSGGFLNKQIDKIFSLKYAVKENRKNDVENIIRDLVTFIGKLPFPIATPKNAYQALKNKKTFPGSTFYGGYSMSDRKIKISARALLNLIAGNIAPEKLLGDHGHAGMHLKKKIDQGYKLNSLSVEKVEEYDDDWVEFVFDEKHDPAVSKFRSRKV